MVRHLLSIKDISREEFEPLLMRFVENPESRSVKMLDGRMIGLLFDRPSTRTRLSFHKAINLLGGRPVALRSRELQLSTGEDSRDTAKMLPLYLDGLVVRTNSVQELRIYARQKQMAIVNALTDEEHPTQAMADLMAIFKVMGSLEGLRILFMGEGGNIAVSFLLACSMIPGLFVTFITPRAYALPEGIINEAFRIGVAVNGRITERHDPDVVPAGVDIVYTTRWRSMGKEKQEEDWLRHFQGFQVTKELLQTVGGSRPARLMHDLPAERGAEVTDDLLDNQQELMICQAAHKANAAMAALAWCFES